MKVHESYSRNSGLISYMAKGLARELAKVQWAVIRTSNILGGSPKVPGRIAILVSLRKLVLK